MADKKEKDWHKFKKEHEEAEKPEQELVEEEEEQQVPLSLDHPSYAALEEQLTLAEQKAMDNEQKALRALAELQNVRRISEDNVRKAHMYGSSKLIENLLPVLDSLEQALHLVTNVPSMEEGLQLTMKQFLDVLQKQNVVQLNPLGEIFNPQEHEAMTMQESNDAKPNTILAVFQKGYKLHDRVIRPARVVIAKPKE